MTNGSMKHAFQILRWAQDDNAVSSVILSAARDLSIINVILPLTVSSHHAVASAASDSATLSTAPYFSKPLVAGFFF